MNQYKDKLIPKIVETDIKIFKNELISLPENMRNLIECGICMTILIDPKECN